MHRGLLLHTMTFVGSESRHIRTFIHSHTMKNTSQNFWLPLNTPAETPLLALPMPKTKRILTVAHPLQKVLESFSQFSRLFKKAEE